MSDDTLKFDSASDAAAWALFAANVLHALVEEGVGLVAVDVSGAAAYADAMLAEYRKRDGQ